MNLIHRNMKMKITGIVVILILVLAIPIDSFGQGKGNPKGPPPWAPAHGYKAKTRHIYFPDQNFYFDLQANEYIYLKGDAWQVSVALPSLYVGIDLGGALKVELELNTNSPQQFNSDHIVKYKAKDKEGKDKTKANKGRTGKGKVPKK